MNLHGRSFLTLKDYTKEEIRYLLDLAHKLKADKKKGILGKSLVGKNIVLLFEKTSTRTRCAFEVAALDEGGHVTYLSNSQMGKKESIDCLLYTSILGFLVAIDFDQAFIIFHKLFFRNDFWIFDYRTDPVITILPETFFMHCFILIVLIIVVFALLCLIFYRYKQKQIISDTNL